MIQNIVIGTPLVSPCSILALDEDDWRLNESRVTLFTNERYLPKVLKEAGIVPSTSEVIRNRKDLCVTLDTPDCRWVQWGRNKVYIVVGEG